MKAPRSNLWAHHEVPREGKGTVLFCLPANHIPSAQRQAVSFSDFGLHAEVAFLIRSAFPLPQVAFGAVPAAFAGRLGVKARV
jgi:hypothetical protein